MEYDRDSELVTRMGNVLYAGLKEAGVTTPSNFQGYKVARDLLFLARSDPQGWDNQKVSIFVGIAFVIGLMVGLPF